MNSSGLASIPNYIKAAELKTLRRLMLENNIKKGVHFRYFDIQHVKGFWYAFYVDIDSTQFDVTILKED